MILAKGEKSDVMYNENWDNWVLEKKAWILNIWFCYETLFE